MRRSLMVTAIFATVTLPVAAADGGGELSNNTKRVEMAWLTLVDALPASRASLEVQ